MSYILDALRKSEHERQMATGKITGMLYPVQIDQRKSAMPWIVLVSVITLLLLLAAVWKFWPQAEVKGPVAAEPRISAESFPKLQLQQPHLMTEPEEDVTVVEAPARKRERGAVKAEVAAAPAVSRPAEAKRSAARIVAVDKPPAAAPETSESTASAEPAAPVDPLAGMPELIIYGYVHNETGGSFAMINDRLLQEGDEIAPGLKLVKILETKGVFNYRGHEFTR
jgi:general secretion pathway protein B